MRKQALPAISIVGPGRLGSGMVLALRAAGYRIAEVAVRGRAQSARPVRALARKVGARVVPLAAADFTAPVVWITVPDDAIAACAAGISKRGAWKGKVVLHASGALSSTELAPLRRRGALTASLHPMMSFAGGPAAPRLKGVLFAFEGDARAAGAARRIVRDLGGQFFLIAPRAKPLYHAWGSLSSPLVMATLATGELVARRAGIPAATVQRAIRPIVERTFQNYLRRGVTGAFTGPLTRGDVVTIARHLEALRRLPRAREVYVALLRSALDLLPVKKRRRMLRLLKEEDGKKPARRRG
jgi:predicted short-subunit dehydrogenase-like oxidoreductase (DUF2520 family)